MVSRHSKSDCVVHVEPFVRLHQLDNPLAEVVKDAEMHCMEKAGFREVNHDTENMSKHIESSVNMMRLAFGIGCFGVGIAECPV